MQRLLAVIVKLPHDIEQVLNIVSKEEEGRFLCYCHGTFYHVFEKI